MMNIFDPKITVGQIIEDYWPEKMEDAKVELSRYLLKCEANKLSFKSLAKVASAIDVDMEKVIARFKHGTA